MRRCRREQVTPFVKIISIGNSKIKVTPLKKSLAEVQSQLIKNFGKTKMPDSDTDVYDV